MLKCRINLGSLSGFCYLRESCVWTFSITNCIFPRLTISGQICSYRYEYPRDLVSVYKVGLNGIIHLGVFAGGSLKISRLVIFKLLNFTISNVHLRR